ncbi:hypothetical protein WKR88_11260 [Trinickia caryophylli]|uniref:Uncharacterized protein n=1 Tax=Trinickia caryophylli TaxID=28094 RepID=A0A1X7E183_TRICW|nr:hypothetical protein [Trinickia caryophylli]PMS14079.1 hypothetical protein C0Z17_00615 [Trinickia caryophylli]TRX17776.1 hypothetical protein FNF07_05755 [Trinickia caryophylli]WQE11458.1 hypothetical protein U0034_17160 [Trinickia caryophylli]SMF25150.1 hypothetical protein SAMN06295900_104317 [Trinickia caryophylli]GLU32623.1 hypothetical protein Busp01_24650 [Trinickia caryophylli]
MTIAIHAVAAPQTTSGHPLGQEYVPIGYVPTIVGGEPYPPLASVPGERFARSAPAEPAEDRTIAVMYDHGCEVYTAGQTGLEASGRQGGAES